MSVSCVHVSHPSRDASSLLHHSFPILIRSVFAPPHHTTYTITITTTRTEDTHHTWDRSGYACTHVQGQAIACCGTRHRQYMYICIGVGPSLVSSSTPSTPRTDTSPSPSAAEPGFTRGRLSISTSSNNLAHAIDVVQPVSVAGQGGSNGTTKRTSKRGHGDGNVS